jgi:hypothetical protein
LLFSSSGPRSLLPTRRLITDFPATTPEIRTVSDLAAVEEVSTTVALTGHRAAIPVPIHPAGRRATD